MIRIIHRHVTDNTICLLFGYVLCMGELMFPNFCTPHSHSFDVTFISFRALISLLTTVMIKWLISLLSSLKGFSFESRPMDRTFRQVFLFSWDWHKKYWNSLTKESKIIFYTVNLNPSRVRCSVFQRMKLWKWNSAFTLAKNATKPNPFEITPLQTTRKENNWKNKEALARAAVTVETERIKGSNPWFYDDYDDDDDDDE